MAIDNSARAPIMNLNIQRVDQDEYRQAGAREKGSPTESPFRRAEGKTPWERIGERACTSIRFRVSPLQRRAAAQRAVTRVEPRERGLSSLAGEGPFLLQIAGLRIGRLEDCGLEV